MDIAPLATAPFAASTPRILVVDDAPVDRLMLSAVLKKEGFEVLNASNGAEGLAQARRWQPDLILLDVVMPGENGFETCRKLKHDGQVSAIPVIFLSGAEAVESRVTGLTEGGVDYIIKPFEPREVLARIRVHLRIRRAFQALVEYQQAQLKQLQAAQQAILLAPEDFPAARFAVYYRALHAAGGDFYDVIGLGENIIGYFTADVGGHDLGAAYITSALKALLRQNFSLLYTPVETMTLLNDVLRSVLSEGVLLSACCLRLNRRTGQAVVVGAGHPPLVHLPAQGPAQCIAAEGDLLGAFATPYFEARELQVAPGDRLLLFSDGLIESQLGRAVARRQGLAALVAAAEAQRAAPLAEMVANTALTLCPASQANEDDLLLLGVEV